MPSQDNSYCTDGKLPKRARRSRTTFDASAISRLESIFENERYPDINLRETLAQEVGVPEARIQTWFQNRRSRTKKPNSKIQEMAPVRKSAKFRKEKPSCGEEDPSATKSNSRAVGQSDSECGTISSAFHRVAEFHQENINIVKLPSSHPFNGDHYSPQRYSGSPIGNTHCYNSGLLHNFVLSSAKLQPFLGSNSYPYAHTFPPTPNSTPLPITPPSVTSSTASVTLSPYCSPQQFVYTPPDEPLSPNGKSVREIHQMEPLDLSMATHSTSSSDEDDLYIDVCS